MIYGDDGSRADAAVVGGGPATCSSRKAAEKGRCRRKPGNDDDWLRWEMRTKRYAPSVYKQYVTASTEREYSLMVAAASNALMRTSDRADGEERDKTCLPLGGSPDGADAFGKVKVQIGRAHV